MQFDSANLIPLLPEIFVGAMACVILVVDLFLSDRRRHLTYGLTLATLAAALGLTLFLSQAETQVLMDGSYVRDAMSDGLKAFVFLVSFFAFVYSKDYLRQQRLFRGEFYVLGLFAVLGMTIMVSANSFLSVYLGLELLALSLYALVAFDRDSRRGSEAAMKYFVLGAIGSGMLLYGVSMIYGATGSIEFGAVAEAVGQKGTSDKVLVFGLVFVIIGVAFKFGAVPFHMWVPDIYEGAPTPVALFLGSAPKLAAFALAMRLLVDGLGNLHADWQAMLIILAVLSMILGNVVAVAQTNIKRMLAYSTISHVGFIFLGILAGSAQGYAAAMFYTVVYAMMAAGAFGILVLLGREGFEAERLADLAGLNERSPWYAAMMGLLMFSMAGVPPTVGFMAKLLVLEAVVRIDLIWIAIVAVAFSIIGAFYYIRIIKIMYFDKPEENAPLAASTGTRVAVSVNGLAMLLLGLFPASLLSYCQGVFAG